MAEPRSRDPDTGDDTQASPAGGAPTGTPRWVKVFGIIALVVVVLLVILLVAGRGGGHGPGRHLPGGDRSDGHTGPPQGVTHQQP
jgi:hypothetical protein